MQFVNQFDTIRLVRSSTSLPVVPCFFSMRSITRNHPLIYAFINYFLPASLFLLRCPVMHSGVRIPTVLANIVACVLYGPTYRKAPKAQPIPRTISHERMHAFFLDNALYKSGTVFDYISRILIDIKTTGITIDNFQENPEGSGVFTFRVSFADEPLQQPSTSPPSNVPTILPTKPPTEIPTNKPSRAPTNPLTDEPIGALTEPPTNSPTKESTKTSTENPTTMPTNQPSKSPTSPPTAQPTTVPSERPTVHPTEPTMLPSGAPTNSPTTTSLPTDIPTQSPTQLPTKLPTTTPTKVPTQSPTRFPSKSPTSAPTDSPTTAVPTESPTTEPVPTEDPTIAPTKPRPTLAPFDVSECSHIIEVSITTDDHPEETTWEIVSSSTGQFLTGYRSSEDLQPKRSLKAYTEYTWKICDSDENTSFHFFVYDTGSNGIQPPGKFSLSLDGEIKVSGGPFTGESVMVGVNK